MATQKSQRLADLQTLRGELVKQLARLDFRSGSIGPALAKMPGTLNAPSGGC